MTWSPGGAAASSREASRSAAVPLALAGDPRQTPDGPGCTQRVPIESFPSRFVSSSILPDRNSPDPKMMDRQCLRNRQTRSEDRQARCPHVHAFGYVRIRVMPFRVCACVRRAAATVAVAWPRGLARVTANEPAHSRRGMARRGL